MKKLSILIMLVVIAVGVWIGFQQVRPPAPPSAADADYPAFQRMLANLEAMAVAPHPSGSEELETVRSYLLTQIHDMGLEATVESRSYTAADLAGLTLARSRPHIAVRVGGVSVADQGQVGNPPIDQSALLDRLADNLRSRAVFDENDQVTLQNILVKLDAPGTERGTLLLAHYDGTSINPGAADDMVSVCALLEALREQAGNVDRQSDLYFLFTDGEELGTIGAQVFVEAHPELQSSIDLVVNMDARGDRGGLLMFETSTPNYDLLRYFRSAASHPLAFSFLPTLYHRMPKSTDLTDFLQAGYSGLNFAVTEGVENYEGPSDTVENLDRGTAYNFLQTAMEMADYAAHVPFEGGRTNQDGVYFTLLPGHLLLMSDVTAYALSGFVVLAALAWLVFQIRSGRVRFSQVAGGTGWLLGSIAVLTLLSWGMVRLLTQGMPSNQSSISDTLFLVLVFVLGACTLALFTFRMRRLSPAEALAGLLPLQLLLIVGTAVFFNAISYLFALPTLGILIVAVLERYKVGRLVASTVLGVGILLLYVPTCWVIYVLFMLPITPAVVALGVMPISTIAAFFAASSATLSTTKPLA